MEETTHEKLWEECLEIIKDNIPPEQYKMWFKDITSLSYENQCVTLKLPSSFYVERWEELYGKLICSTISRVYGKGVQLYYNYPVVVGNNPTTQSTISPKPGSHQQLVSANPFQPQKSGDLDPQLNPHYTFENYCESMSNKLARSIGEAIANNPKCKTFNPLFIFGPTGVGKTHLIQAIGIRIKETNPHSRVLYITARLFESQFTAAAIRGKINEFINFYQSIDVLIIDDIQDLMGKLKTQNTFFHIFNHLQQNQKQLILSSDCRPSEMDGMEERLLSRFRWGVTAELEHPDFELRTKILKQKSEQEGLSIPADVLEYIATNVTNSARELEGIVVSLIAHTIMLNKDLTIDLARNVLDNAVKTSKRQINFDWVVECVCAHYNIEIDNLYSKTRKREISDARQLVMYLAKKFTNMSYTAIGTRLKRTHATILYAVNSIEGRMAIDHKLQDDISQLECAIRS